MGPRAVSKSKINISAPKLVLWQFGYGHNLTEIVSVIFGHVRISKVKNVDFFVFRPLSGPNLVYFIMAPSGSGLEK